MSNAYHLAQEEGCDANAAWDSAIEAVTAYIKEQRSRY